MARTELHEAVARYYEAGIHCVPVHPASKKCLVRGWPRKRYSPEHVWTAPEWSDDRMVGMLHGEPSGWLVCVDPDTDEAVWIAGRVFGGTLSVGRQSKRHARWYVYAPGAKSKQFDDGKGERVLDVLSTGRHSVVPPSTHSDTGQALEWNGGFDRSRIERMSAEELMRKARIVASAAIIAGRMPEKGRHDFALALAGFFQRPGRLDGETTEQILRLAWAYHGAEEEVMRALGGMTERSADRQRAGEPNTGGPTMEGTSEGISKALAKVWEWRLPRRTEAPTQDELRDRWIEDNPHVVSSPGGWRRYDPDTGLWSAIEEPEIRDSIWLTLESAKGEGVRPTASLVRGVEEAIQARRHVSAWDADPDILVCSNGTLRISTGELGPHSPEHHATTGVPYEYDPLADAPNWRCFLEDLAFRIDETVKEDLRARAAEETDPEKKAKLIWEAGAVTAGDEVVRLLQEYAGYALTTRTEHEMALWLYGERGAGRSTFIEGLMAMLGEGRWGKLSLSNIMSRFGLAGIEGKTLLVATEQPADYVRSTDRLIEIISGEPVWLERKGKDGYEYRPVAKLVWAMNRLPRIHDAASGLFRCVVVVEFPRVPEDERDPQLKASIQAEGGGILTWALEGLVRLNERGRFAVPEYVKEAISQFQAASDVEARFVEECCAVGEGHRVRPAHLYAAYRQWCALNGHQPKSATAVASDWARLGFRKGPVNGYAHYKGLDVDKTGVAECGRMLIPSR